MTTTLEPLAAHRHDDPMIGSTALDDHEDCDDRDDRGVDLGVRAACLAAGLHRMGVSAGTSVGVLVCDQHTDDHEVALIAAHMLDAVVTVYSVHEPLRALAGGLESDRGELLLACAEGVTQWRQTGVPRRVVGDGPGVVWWRAMELQEGITCRTTPVTTTCSSNAETAGSSPSR